MINDFYLFKISQNELILIKDCIESFEKEGPEPSKPTLPPPEWQTPHNTTNDISYAKKYCKTYNSAYISYKGNGRDCANFVIQCLKAGGLDLSKCGNKDNKEMIINCVYLRSCHQKKG